jgi:peptide-methionine (S)-S-oxide reductase
MVFRRHGGKILAIAKGALLLQAWPARALQIPDPATDEPAAAAGGTETVVLAGGCFWGIQAIFERVKGVTHATAGYSGGPASAAHYEMVSTGTTGHAESVEVTFDPARVTLGQILKIYFAVAHNPTELNYQGPDAGPQYRSAIFFATPAQQRVAQAYIAQLQAAKAFPQPIVTAVEPLKAFYPAEAYHQDYADHHPESMYIVINDLPKIHNFEREFPALYAAR